MNKEKWDCPLIHGHLEIQPDGLVYPCCASLTPKALGSLHEESLEDIWGGDNRSAIGEAFAKGEGKGVEHCRFCVEQEKKGLKSEREKEAQRWQAKGLSQNQNPSKPVSLGVRFSNLCNFSCRTCRPAASTSWFKDAKFMNPKGDFHQVTSSSKDNPLWKQIECLLEKGLERLYFAGGEPLLEKDHYLLLEKLMAIPKEQRNAIQIEYDTNLSTLTLGQYSVLEMWKKLPQVMVSVSLDGYGKKGEYLRKGMDWSLILKNLSLIKENCSHVKIAINYVLNNYNVFHLKEFKTFIESESLFEGVIFNLSFCEDPEFLDIKVLPQKYKNSLENELVDFPEAIQYLRSATREVAIEKFHSQIKILDFLRGENFSQIFPKEYEFFFS